jgi:hypothetical protein
MKVGFVKLIDVESSFQTLVSEVCDAIAETWSYDNFCDISSHHVSVQLLFGNASGASRKRTDYISAAKGPASHDCDNSGDRD